MTIEEKAREIFQVQEYMECEDEKLIGRHISWDDEPVKIE